MLFEVIQEVVIACEKKIPQAGAMWIIFNNALVIGVIVAQLPRE